MEMSVLLTTGQHWRRVLWVLLSCYVAFALPFEPVVTTDKGRVRGTRIEFLGKPLDVFYGIPYAKPPTGERRFKHPQHNDPWTGIFNATRKPNTCVQYRDTVFRNFSGSNQWNPNTKVDEDCLYLNVWAPRHSSPSSNKAVMAWIYGGSFFSGSSTIDVYDARILSAENDVVVVSMQYRVGSLGFLALGHPDAPGNAGMFDQVMALDWIQRNIHQFGGSAHNVTIFGESAGSVSVSMHLLSPLSRGKFARAILQSGTAVSAWGTLNRKESTRRGLELAKSVNCDKSGDMGEIIKCMRTMPAEVYPEKEFGVSVSVGVFQFAFVPIIDGSFLIEDPNTSLKRNNFKKCPILMGTNTNEGSWLLIYQYDEFERDSESFLTREEFRLRAEVVVEYYPQYPHKMNAFGKEAAVFQYTNWHNVHDGARNRDNIDAIVGDYHIICGSTHWANEYARFGQKVYYYRFMHRSSHNIWPLWMGVMHGDEIFYVFGKPVDPNFSFHRHERELSRKMMKLWTNFAKSGNPNQDPGDYSFDEVWPPYSAQHNEYLKFDVKYIRHPNKWKDAIGHGVRMQQCAFWREYLPRLHLGTGDITEAEFEWKREFHRWQTNYIVDWKHQFDSFLQNQEKRFQSCGEHMYMTIEKHNNSCTSGSSTTVSRVASHTAILILLALVSQYIL